MEYNCSQIVRASPVPEPKKKHGRQKTKSTIANKSKVKKDVATKRKVGRPRKTTTPKSSPKQKKKQPKTPPKKNMRTTMSGGTKKKTEKTAKKTDKSKRPEVKSPEPSSPSGSEEMTLSEFESRYCSPPGPRMSSSGHSSASSTIGCPDSHDVKRTREKRQHSLHVLTVPSAHQGFSTTIFYLKNIW